VNGTILSLLGTLAEDKKSRWKEYLHTLVMAYNCTPHQTTGFSPYELMFGRLPQLPIDHAFGLSNVVHRDNSYADFVDNLKERITYSQSLAKKHMHDKADRFIRNDRPTSILEVGDRVLVRNVGLVGRHKLADRWRNDVYIVVKQSNPNIPVYEVKPESGTGKSKVLHRSMLLFIGSVSIPRVEAKPQTPVDKAKPRKVLKARDKSPVALKEQDCKSSSDDEFVIIKSRPSTYSDSIQAIDNFVVDSDPGNHDGSVSNVVLDQSFPDQTEVEHVDGGDLEHSESEPSEPDEPIPIRRPTRARRRPDRFEAEMFSKKSKFLLELVDKIFV
jgi:hypothetical protein